MDTVVYETYKEDSLLKRLMKKLFKSLFKKEYVLIIDSSHLLPESKEENMEKTVKEKNQEVIEAKVDIMPEENTIEDCSTNSFDENVVFEKIITKEEYIENYNEDEILKLMNLLNEKLLIDSKKLDRKIELVQNKL